MASITIAKSPLGAPAAGASAPAPKSVFVRLSTPLAGVAIFVLIVALWHLATVTFSLPNYLVPKPLEVLHAIRANPARLFGALWITALEATGGLVSSIVIGVLVAIFFAQSRRVRQVLYPYTILLQTVPIVAVAPLILNWFGAGLWQVMLIAFIICLFPIIANTTQGLISVERNLRHLFAMHNASGAQVLWRLQLPHALPSLFTGIRISSGISVIGAITGELFASSNRVGEGGLGYSIIYANSQLQTDFLFALVLASSALGFTFFFLVIFFEWLFLHHWHESATPVDGD